MGQECVVSTLLHEPRYAQLISIFWTSLKNDLGLYAFALVSIVNVATAVSYFRSGNPFPYPLSLLVDYAPEISSPPSYQCGVGLPMIVVVSNIMVCPFHY